MADGTIDSICERYASGYRGIFLGGAWGLGDYMLSKI
jgi:hypothetical protein